MSSFCCGCVDPGCPVHPGSLTCDSESAMTLYRVDMDDVSGVDFCFGCGEDAMLSGMFDTDDPGLTAQGHAEEDWWSDT